MYRGTTPTLPIRVLGADIHLAKVYLTIEDMRTGRQITLTAPGDFTVAWDDELQATVGDVTLTQEQTLSLKAGGCWAQVRWVFPDGAAGATVRRTITVEDVILKDVITYAE